MTSLVLYVVASLLAAVVSLGVLGLGLWLLRPIKPIPVALGDGEEQDAGVDFWTAVFLDLKTRYPYLPKPEVAELSGDALMRGILDVLFDGGFYGFHDQYLPVPALPEAERKRHLYVVGKTGTGKSTFLEHLITRDMNAGRGVIVLSPEGEFFRDRLLNLVPDERHGDLVYVAPRNPSSMIGLNPMALETGDEPLRAADELFEILRRSLGSDGLGPRMRPLLQNALGALVGRSGSTLLDVKRLCEDEAFRREVLVGADPYVRSYWEDTFPRLAKGATTPIVYRLDRFLRAPVLRRFLGARGAGLSIRRALRGKKILFVDLYGLAPSQRMLIGLIVLSKIQLELMAREHGGTQTPCSLYCDEFQSFAGVSVDLWRELLSRGRKYGLSLTLANQYPAQLPTGLRDEIFGNVNSRVAFALGARDAGAVCRELLVEGERQLQPIETSAIIDQKVGHAVVSLAGGRATQVRMSPPLAFDDEKALHLMEASWERYGEAEVPKPAAEPLEPSEAVVEASELPLVDPPPSAPDPPPLPGRGGPEHVYLQSLVKGWGEEQGFVSVVEEGLPDGGFVDVALRKGDQRIAVEIAVSSDARHEVANAVKCLDAGFGEVLVVSTRKRLLGEIKRRLPEEAAGRVETLTPDEALSQLSGYSDESEPPDATTIAGYRVTVSYDGGSDLDARARQRAIGELLRRGSVS